MANAAKYIVGGLLLMFISSVFVYHVIIYHFKDIFLIFSAVMFLIGFYFFVGGVISFYKIRTKKKRIKNTIDIDEIRNNGNKNNNRDKTINNNKHINNKTTNNNKHINKTTNNNKTINKNNNRDKTIINNEHINNKTINSNIDTKKSHSNESNNENISNQNSNSHKYNNKHNNKKSINLDNTNNTNNTNNINNFINENPDKINDIVINDMINSYDNKKTIDSSKSSINDLKNSQKVDQMNSNKNNMPEPTKSNIDSNNASSINSNNLSCPTKKQKSGFNFDDNSYMAKLSKPTPIKSNFINTGSNKVGPIKSKFIEDQNNQELALKSKKSRINLKSKIKSKSNLKNDATTTKLVFTPNYDKPTKIARPNKKSESVSGRSFSHSNFSSFNSPNLLSNKDTELKSVLKKSSKENFIHQLNDDVQSNSFVLYGDELIDSDNAFERLIKTAKHEILIESTSIKGISNKFLDILSTTNTKIIIQGFDPNDVSYALLINSLLNRGVSVKTLPFINTTNIIADNNALIISEADRNSDFEVGALYNDIDVVNDIKNSFKDLWAISNDLRLDLY
ncbi:phosphatidylserine/phosphatidylglycerophosphate/cardiolipin synthase family protein [Methanobrevibacter filiformis]|uniref:Uncharacterized protein n=1 Tax=Methanobrevibacter filiformis TaxID=55758 RepID=A0A165ZCZ8_9EURY|nr:phosphatidylserine/phosphatidylglycerophosphate/cardiolipin synthase family protein [Methanobrevibacter filiformis]KZX10554.1 hypothetical protein MBFIL_17270 [Methanobrevibacter filiformis]